MFAGFSYLNRHRVHQPVFQKIKGKEFKEIDKKKNTEKADLIASPVTANVHMVKPLTLCEILFTIDQYVKTF